MDPAPIGPGAVHLAEIAMAPPVLLAGEDDEESADAHIVRGID
ncbi:surface protein [Streptomyces sp. NPDC097107]